MKALLSTIAALCMVSATASVPVYGTAHYGRPLWTYRPAPYYRQPYPMTYPEDYYYQTDPIVHYPYYAMPRSYAKSDVYQTPYSYYYNDRLRPYYYSAENAYATPDDLPDNVHDDSMRSNGRTDSLPVGQETWFEGESLPRWQNDYDDVNAAFLQNLMMYNDAIGKTEQNESGKTQNQDIKPETDDYDSRSTVYYGDRDTRDFEDEDVKELKALAGKPLYHVPKTNNYQANKDNTYRSQQWRKDYSTPTAVRRDEDHYNDDYPNDDAWITWGSKRADKNINKQQKQKMIKSTMMPPITSTIISTTRNPVVTAAGQKEEVLLRPATPVRHPFSEPVMQMLAANSIEKKRTPSVYDTIKQLLSMEETYKPNRENGARVQKRFVATEEDLVGELKGLKRRSPA